MFVWQWKRLEDFPSDYKESRVLLFSPSMKNDPSYPGHCVSVSNTDYVRCGNAIKHGYTHWHECPPDPV